MRDVAIVGVGMTEFGELWSKSLRTIWAEAALAALADAGVDKVDLITIGCMSPGLFVGQEHLASLLADELGMAGTAASRVESACASGGLALRTGFAEVAVGLVRHGARDRGRKDERRRRRRRDLRAGHRGGPGVGGFPRHHLPRPLRHAGAGPHAALRHDRRAAGGGRGQEPRQRLAQPPRPVPPQADRQERAGVDDGRRSPAADGLLAGDRRRGGAGPDHGREREKNRRQDDRWSPSPARGSPPTPSRSPTAKT